MKTTEDTEDAEDHREKLADEGVRATPNHPAIGSLEVPRLPTIPLQSDAVSDSQENFAAMRATAREIFLQALGECGVDDAITSNVEVSRGLLRVCEDLYDLRTYSRIFVVAMGKASRAMAETLQHQMGSGIGGIVVQAETYSEVPMLAGFRHFHGGHPVPN